MVTFRNNNNNRRSNFRRNDRNFKYNGERQKFTSNFSNNDTFKRKSPGRNNHNAPKLIEKYNDLAREALSNGDKILSENYLQHADHFTRILNEKENFRREKYSVNKTEVNENQEALPSDRPDHNLENNTTDEASDDIEAKKSEKTQVEAN